jgi:hypothetical protein
MLVNNNNHYQRPARSATIVSDDVTDTLESCTGGVDLTENKR